jgi:hypothetical protein
MGVTLNGLQGVISQKIELKNVTIVEKAIEVS